MSELSLRRKLDCRPLTHGSSASGLVHTRILLNTISNDRHVFTPLLACSRDRHVAAGSTREVLAPPTLNFPAARSWIRSDVHALAALEYVCSASPLHFSNDNITPAS